ncbi:MAG: hypothetical protein IPH10_11275 [bacterium]|nr:hypothetical protein [bacterium]
MMLLFYYEPTVSEAHESVEYITHFMTMGALIRTCTHGPLLHDLCVIAHMLSALAMKASAMPREITGIAGALLP